jgi:PIN domain nuclease of toxin-antitoxin system
VRFLLDTHAVLWWFSDDPRLSRSVGAALDNAENDLFLSAVSGYEIIYKRSTGRLPTAPDDLNRRLQRASITILPLTLDHAIAAASLPGPHRDPWDRVIMAQAIAENLTVVTVDRVFRDYGVPVFW